MINYCQVIQTDILHNLFIPNQSLLLVYPQSISFTCFILVQILYWPFFYFLEKLEINMVTCLKYFLLLTLSISAVRLEQLSAEESTIKPPLMFALGIQFDSFSSSAIVKVAASTVDTDGVGSNHSTKTRQLFNECARNHQTVVKYKKMPFSLLYQFPSVDTAMSCVDEYDKEFRLSIDNDRIDYNSVLYFEAFVSLFERIKHSLQTQFGLTDDLLHKFSNSSLAYVSIVMPKDNALSNSGITWDMVKAAAEKVRIFEIHRYDQTSAALRVCDANTTNDEGLAIIYSIVHFGESALRVTILEYEYYLIDVLTLVTMDYTSPLWDATTVMDYVSLLLKNATLSFMNSETPNYLDGSNNNMNDYNSTQLEPESVVIITTTDASFSTKSNSSTKQMFLLNGFTKDVEDYISNSETNLTLCTAETIMPRVNFGNLIVAFGAALRSVDRILASQENWEEPLLGAVEINPLHYGVELAGGVMHPILKRHYLEGPQSAVFTTLKRIDNRQRHSIIEIPIYRGFWMNTDNNTYMGTIYFKLGPSSSNERPKIRVLFDNTLETPFKLNVTVIDEATGQFNQSLFPYNWQDLASEILAFDQSWDADTYEQNKKDNQDFKEAVQCRIPFLVTMSESWWDRTLFKLSVFFQSAQRKEETVDIRLSSSSNKLVELF
ncbi:MAG: hypothetical protein EXX96DRAFT_573910 [Benjaminiella poitrasii]|nr:MAG: hypothetical protein EXX96DRAFT_573910 [Benjaminiella poitrasii]